MKQTTPVSGQFGILMSDLRGYTALTEQHSPLTLLPLLDHYFSTMTRVITTHGGVVDKFMGDAVLAHFELQQQPDAVARMLSCAVEMQMAMDDVNLLAARLQLPDLFMGIGVDVGPVVLCELGSDLHRETTVLGSPVNVVARMAAFALRGQVLLTAQVLQHCHDLAETGADFKLLLKGKKQVIRVHELQALRGAVPKRVPLRENRRSPRAETLLPATYHRVEGKRVTAGAIHADIIDLSYGGMRLLTPQEHRLLDEIRIVMPFALGEQQLSDIYAKVLSCQRQDDDGWCISVEFTWLDEYARQAIHSLVDHLV